MKKVMLSLIVLFAPAGALAQAANYCGEVERLRVWANGGDAYGIWVEYKANPHVCPDGFFMPHVSDNKEFMFSLLLSAKVAKENICIQTYPNNSDWVIADRCKINYVMHR